MDETWMPSGPAILEFSARATPPEYPEMRIQAQATLEVPITVDP